MDSNPPRNSRGVQNQPALECPQCLVREQKDRIWEMRKWNPEASVWEWKQVPRQKTYGEFWREIFTNLDEKQIEEDQLLQSDKDRVYAKHLQNQKKGDSPVKSLPRTRRTRGKGTTVSYDTDDTLSDPENAPSSDIQRKGTIKAGTVLKNERKRANTSKPRSTSHNKNGDSHPKKRSKVLERADKIADPPFPNLNAGLSREGVASKRKSKLQIKDDDWNGLGSGAKGRSAQSPGDESSLFLPK